MKRSELLHELFSTAIVEAFACFEGVHGQTASPEIIEGLQRHSLEPLNNILRAVRVTLQQFWIVQINLSVNGSEQPIAVGIDDLNSILFGVYKAIPADCKVEWRNLSVVKHRFSLLDVP